MLNNHAIYIPISQTRVHTVKYLYILLDSKVDSIPLHQCFEMGFAFGKWGFHSALSSLVVGSTGVKWDTLGF